MLLSKSLARYPFKLHDKQLFSRPMGMETQNVLSAFLVSRMHCHGNSNFYPNSASKDFVITPIWCNEFLTSRVEISSFRLKSNGMYHYLLKGYSLCQKATTLTQRLQLNPKPIVQIINCPKITAQCLPSQGHF
jgi:hypothetical protein